MINLIRDILKLTLFAPIAVGCYIIHKTILLYERAKDTSNRRPPEPFT